MGISANDKNEGYNAFIRLSKGQMCLVSYYSSISERHGLHKDTCICYYSSRMACRM